VKRLFQNLKFKLARLDGARERERCDRSGHEQHLTLQGVFAQFFAQSPERNQRINLSDALARDELRIQDQLLEDRIIPTLG
jgi:hypothetical protein